MSNLAHDQNDETKPALQQSLPDEQQQFSCKVCLESIPLSESEISEAEDYITYFCGLDCYDTWVHQQDQK